MVPPGSLRERRNRRAEQAGIIRAIHIGGQGEERFARMLESGPRHSGSRMAMVEDKAWESPNPDFVVRAANAFAGL
jgi:hypothetical protein